MMYREANVRKAIRGFSLKTTPESAKIKLPSIDFLTGKPNSIQETESKIDSDVNLIKARSTDSSILSDSQSEQLYDQEHASDEANASTAKEPPSSASNYIQGENLKVSTNEIWDESLWQEYSGSEAALEAQVRLGLNFGVSSVKRRKRKVIKLSREEASKLIDGSESDTTETTTVTEQFEHSQAQYAQYAQYAQLDGWARSPFISQPMYPDWQRTAQSIPQVQPPPPAPSPPPRVSLPISHSEMSFSPSSGWQPSFFPGPYLPDHAHRVDTLASTHTASVPPTPIGRSIGNIQSQPPPSAVSSNELSISGRSNQPLAGPPACASPGPASIVDPSHPSPQAPYTISSPKASSITSSPTPLSPPPPAPSGPLSPVACPIESAPSPPPPPFLTTFPDPSTESPQSHGALIDVNYSPCPPPPLARPRERDQESDRGWSASGSSKARKKKKTARKARARSPSEDKIQERDQDGDSDSDDWNTTTKRKRGKKTEATLKLSTGSKNVTIEEIRSSSAERGVSTSSHQYRPILS
jgi:hypothetical protein